MSQNTPQQRIDDLLQQVGIDKVLFDNPLFQSLPDDAERRSLSRSRGADPCGMGKARVAALCFPLDDSMAADSGTTAFRDQWNG